MQGLSCLLSTRFNFVWSFVARSQWYIKCCFHLVILVLVCHCFTFTQRLSSRRSGRRKLLGTGQPDYLEHNNNCFMALCPGLPVLANTRRNIQPLTHMGWYMPFSGFYGAKEDNKTDTPSIWLDATLSGLLVPPPPSSPPFLCWLPFLSIKSVNYKFYIVSYVTSESEALCAND